MEREETEKRDTGKKDKRQAGIKRIGLAVFQHLLAAIVLLIVASLLVNSYIEVETIDGEQVYRLFSMDMSREFEESDVYHDLFQSAVSDITQLVVIKEQLETGDSFDAGKRIDVTEYARKLGKDEECPITAIYELDELIRWGKYGINYTTASMSMSEFIEYFGNVLFPENFALDEYGQLCFAGFYRVEKEDSAASSDSVRDGEELTELEKLLAGYSQEQQEDMVFSYIMAKNLDGIEVSREEDGRLRISVSMLDYRYSTAGGDRRLIGYADNWVDYMHLQNNIVMAVENLTLNYQRYQICNEAYQADKTNVKYMIRMMTDKGIQTYTNVGELKEREDEAVTEFFSEYRRYLIYYPDSLVFMGNTLLSEEELDEYIGMYAYAYPDTTHIWIGVDTSYSVTEDVFYQAREKYNTIVPNVGKLLAAIVILCFGWLGLGVYLTVTAGTARALNRFDRIPTEIFLALGAGCGYGAFLLGQHIAAVASGTVSAVGFLGAHFNRVYRYCSLGLYGMAISLLIGLFWYSLVRRMKAHSIWRDSLLHYIGAGIQKALHFVFRHRNSVISVLIPYNLFLFLNLAVVVVVFQLDAVSQKKGLVFLIFCGMILFDCIIGVLLFKRNAERIEIVEGISRIRDGEVEFKLDTASLHGENRELADAVNNIGEGIRKAVRTSMKDEQMKTDLITNVSHDIKTPLTSIINYVDLLKRLKITEEPARGYIDILDSKAQRLKQLTDDLVEASKISSGNIELNLEKLNLTELLNQGIGEFSEKWEEKGLQVIFEKEGQTACIYADSRRMWRVVENLFNNICKYAMEGTRVYIDLETEDEKIEVSIKNISRQQMNIKPEELTERFIRGDSSRTTEGSGLGLSIAKNLVQVQGGSFEIQMDGDLFKIVMCFPEYKAEEQQKTQA